MSGFIHDKETPDPHAFLQWKGTDVCMDFYCECGAHCHFDGDFAYAVRCPHCKTIWEMPCNLFPRKADDKTYAGHIEMARAMSDERRIAKTGDVFSLERFIGWLAMQPSEKAYCYTNTGECLLGQYLTACGYIDPGVGGFLGDGVNAFVGPLDDRITIRMPESFGKIAAGHGERSAIKHTFGAALKRARNLNR